MKENSAAQIESKVQFWIDLIQVRAPGSKIIIVATRADLFSSESRDTTIQGLMEQLDYSEKLRISDIETELSEYQAQLELMDYSSQAYRQLKLKMSLLKKSLNMRPHIVTCAPVNVETGVSGFVKPGYDITRLIAAIREVSTATTDEENPFQLVNVYHPPFYAHVKRAAQLLKSSRAILRMKTLHEAAVIEAGVSSASSSTMTMKDTESAVAFLTCIGEVVWFRDRSLCPYEDGAISDDDFDDDWFNGDESGGVMLDGSSMADTAESSVWTESLDIGEYVVLNPHWLLNAVKGVLTHELSTDVKSLREKMGGDTEQKYGWLSDQRNGIVRWPLIEELLSLRSEIGGNEQERKDNLKVLRMLLEHFNIIVHIRMDISDPSNVGTPPLHSGRNLGSTYNSPLMRAKSGIGSVVTYESGVEVHKSNSTSDLLTPSRSTSKESPLTSGRSVGERLHISINPHDSTSGGTIETPLNGKANPDPISPIASVASASALDKLQARGMSAPTEVDSINTGLLSTKRTKSVGDDMFAAKPSKLDVTEDYFLVPGMSMLSHFNHSVMIF